MKLGEALSKLKKSKSRLARLVMLRKQSVYVEKGKEPKFDPAKLAVQINDLIDEIRQLKILVQKTNLQTMIKGEKVTIAEAIIKVNDIRSIIAHLSTLFEQKHDYIYRSEKESKEMVEQLDPVIIEDEIEKREIEKSRLDNLIQIANWTTDLVD